MAANVTISSRNTVHVSANLGWAHPACVRTPGVKRPTANRYQHTTQAVNCPKCLAAFRFLGK